MFTCGKTAFPDLTSSKEKMMESENQWYCEDASENDEEIEKLEAEIHETKSLLRTLSSDEELFFF